MTWVQDKNRSNSDVIDDVYKMVGYKTKIDQYFTFCTYESMTNHYVINNAENKPAPMAPPYPPLVGVLLAKYCTPSLTWGIYKHLQASGITASSSKCPSCT